MVQINRDEAAKKMKNKVRTILRKYGFKKNDYDLGIYRSGHGPNKWKPDTICEEYCIHLYLFPSYPRTQYLLEINQEIDNLNGTFKNYQVKAYNSRNDDAGVFSIDIK